MTATQAGELVALVRAAFPRERVEQETYKLYARFLLDLEYQPARAAVTRLLCRSRFFPSIAELRAEVAEVALGLPGELEAFRLAEAHALWRPEYAPCPRCDGVGLLGEAREQVCSDCHGDGRAITNRPDALPAPVRAAFEYVGGRAGFVDGEPGVVRAHFRDAYRYARAETLEPVSATLLPAVA